MAKGPVKPSPLMFETDYVIYTEPGGSVTFTFINGSSKKEGNKMSEAHARMRITLDIPADPSTASERVVKAIAGEARDYVQVVLVKDREVTLTDHVEVINVHVHKSTEDEACEYCVRKLAMDERQ